MGGAVAKPETSFDLAGHVLFPYETYTVKRGSGEWETGHVATRPSLWDAMRSPPGKIDEFKGPVAAKQLYSSSRPYSPLEEELKWRILVSKGEPGDKKSIYAWRDLEKIRPDGMTEEEAVLWREDVTRYLDSLEAARSS